jgi:hypothetical protein
MAKPVIREQSFTHIAISIGLISFGLTMLLLSAAYLKDLALLTEAPMLLWSALCGRPSADPLTLPVLITMSGTAVLLGLTLLLINFVRSRKKIPCH